MKKIVLTFGLISGAIVSLLMSASLLFADRIGYGHSMMLGYTIIVASMLLVYFGVRSYRDSVGGGHITFGRAFSVGLLITVISCLCYVVVWEILYYNFMPDFMDKYGAYMLAKAKASGASPAAIQAQIEALAKEKKLYANPLMNAAMTFIEPFPVGLLITLVSAAVLRRKASAPAPEPVEGSGLHV